MTFVSPLGFPEISIPIYSDHEIFYSPGRTGLSNGVFYAYRFSWEPNRNPAFFVQFGLEDVWLWNFYRPKQGITLIHDDPPQKRDIQSVRKILGDFRRKMLDLINTRSLDPNREITIGGRSTEIPLFRWTRSGELGDPNPTKPTSRWLGSHWE